MYRPEDTRWEKIFGRPGPSNPCDRCHLTWFRCQCTNPTFNLMSVEAYLARENQDV